jgi:hypothetical protein
MFANPTNVGISQRVVATLVASAMVLASIGYYNTARAANFELISDTISDSDLSALPSHEIAFTIPTGGSLGGGDTTTITFASGFTTVNNVASGDITVTVNGVVDAHGGFAQSGQGFSFNAVTATAGQEVVVAITSGNITNPSSAGSYEVGIVAGTNNGATEVAIIDDVLVQAAVDTNFTFTIAGVATSTTVNGVTTTGSTTPTLINYGEIAAGSLNAEVLGQRLNVSTNAINGFVVTVQSDGALRSANGADIDNFDDASDVAVPGTAWNSPTPNVSNENTWGHWGVTTSDANIGTGDNYYSGVNFGSNQFIAASTTAREVFAHTGPADGSTANIGSTTVAYKVEISALQEAATDYQTTLTYIATPTF